VKVKAAKKQYTTEPLVQVLIDVEREKQIRALQQNVNAAKRRLKDLRFAKSEKKKLQAPQATSD